MEHSAFSEQAGMAGDATAVRAASAVRRSGAFASPGSGPAEAARPLASVVINNYNYGQYLPQAIESALAQAYEPKEIIVVDDGSTDDSRRIIESYGRAITSIFKANGGQPSAYNAGIAASSGETVSFLDSDDIWHPRKLESIMEAMLADPGIVLAYHRFQKTTSDLVAFGEPWPFTLWQGDILARVRRTGGWWPCPASSALTFRREFLVQTGPITESERYLADAILSDLAPFFGKVAGIGEVLGSYRIHDRNFFMQDMQDVDKQTATRRRLELMESRTRILNENLARLGCKFRVSRDDNYYLQMDRRFLGQGKGRLALAFLALRFKGHERMKTRIKNFARLILKGN
jgi:glycosyltransferase involved in cell wall biosynthesis